MNTSSTFTAQGALTAHAETGGTRITGSIQLAPLMVAMFGIAVVYMPFLILRGQLSPILGLAVLGIFGVLAYSRVKDRNTLLQDIRSL